MYCVLYFDSGLDNSQTSEVHVVCCTVNFDSDVVTKVYSMRNSMASRAVTHKSTCDEICTVKKEEKSNRLQIGFGQP